MSIVLSNTYTDPVIRPPVIESLINRRLIINDINNLNHIAAFIPVSTKNILNNGYISKHYIWGINSLKPYKLNPNVCTHAEMDALDKAIDGIKSGKIKNRKMNLIVIRTSNNNKLCSSAPCYHCTLELANNGYIKIKKLYYSTTDNNIKCINFSEYYKKGEYKMSSGWKKYINKNTTKFNGKFNE